MNYVEDHALFTPDQLADGEVKVIEAVIAAGTLVRGSVLGKVTASGNYILSASAAGDGSETPSLILAEDVDASSDPKRAAVIAGGCVNEDELIFGTGHDADSVRAALRDVGIILTKSVG